MNEENNNKENNIPQQRRTKDWRKRKMEDGWIDVHLFMPRELVQSIYDHRRDLVYHYRKNGGK